MLHIKTVFRNKEYKFNSFWGILTSKKSLKNNIVLELCDKNKATKLPNILEGVRNPYKISGQYPLSEDLEVSKWVRRYAKLLIWSHRHFYPLIWLVSKCRFNIYESGIDAADVFCKIHPLSQNTLCLPRSVFIATTSKKFQISGAMFIGAYLPSRRMHAWIIEDGINAYRHDHIWINYTPISIMI